MAVMADQDDRALIVVDRLDQRLAAVDVEMVGRLVEHQDMRPMERGEGEQQPRLLAARQRLAFGIGQLRAEAIGAEPGAPLRLRSARASGSAK